MWMDLTKWYGKIMHLKMHQYLAGGITKKRYESTIRLANEEVKSLMHMHNFIIRFNKHPLLLVCLDSSLVYPRLPENHRLSTCNISSFSLINVEKIWYSTILYVIVIVIVCN